ncbi:Sea24 [Klebsiella pneumoniae]|nr:Sea24 [Klebsiella pneumoniae]
MTWQSSLFVPTALKLKAAWERANQTLQDRLIKEMVWTVLPTLKPRMPGLPLSSLTLTAGFHDRQGSPKDLHRPVQESPDELRDIFAWHDVRTVSKSLTFQYDKILYLIDPTEENSRLAGEKIKVLDYPDGTLAFHYGHRSLKCQAFDKLACVDQGQIVDNKRLGTVLRLAQVKQDERESEGKRERSKKSPSRKAQVRVQEQLRAINPVLADPSLFVASSKR